jgi:hypothetical protein
MSKPNQNQGEGNKEAARDFNKAEQQFVKSGKVTEAAGKAKPKSEAEAKELEHAEKAGRSHSKGEDPAVKGGSGGSGSR